MKTIKKTTVPDRGTGGTDNLVAFTQSVPRKQKSPPKIGSFALGKINFGKDDHFFHIDDPKLQKVKREVKDFVDPDILGLKKPGWNSSSSVEPGPRMDQQKHLFNIRVGLADLKITQLAPKRGYPGCDELRKDFLGSVFHNENTRN